MDHAALLCSSSISYAMHHREHDTTDTIWIANAAQNSIRTTWT